MHRTLIASAVVTAALAAVPAHATTLRVATGYAEGSAFASAVQALDHDDVGIAAWAVDPDGEWIVVGDDQSVAWSAGFDQDIVYGVVLNQFFGRTIEGIDCAPNGRCILVHSRGYVANGPIPSALGQRITSWHNAGIPIRDVELTNTGWLVLGSGSNAAYSGLDPDLSAAIYDRRLSGRTIRDVSIGLDGRWLLYADSAPVYEGLDVYTQTWVDGLAELGWGFDHVLLGPGNSFVMVQPDDQRWAADLADPTEAVEFGLAGNRTIWQRMDDYGVAGLSIAIVRDGRVVSSRGYGTRTDGFQQPVLGSTPFDLASLSKYVGAVTTLAALRDQAPSVSLTADLTTMPGLPTIISWIQRGQASPADQGFAFVNTPNMPAITLEQLFSHTAAISTGGSTPIPFWLQDGVASTLDYLSGWACTTWSCGWAGAQTVWFDPSVGAGGFGGTPGAQYAYSSHGYLVAQAAIEDLTGSSATELVEDYVIDPMGLADTRAGWPWDSAYSARIASQHDEGGAVYRTWYPWIFAGGITSSARDYAEILTLLLNDGVAPNGTRILSVVDAANIRRARTIANRTFSYGLGVDFDGTLGASVNNGEAFYHSGSHPGRANTYMCGRPADSSGIVILMNTDDLNGSTTAFRNEILAAFVAAMGWTDTNCT
ncbi:MAG: beta-lactamase family protein [Alphaproteobacteria bacterium]|nr:beta-lactamase family protein [Alphaproteobacteria bacterium]